MLLLLQSPWTMKSVVLKLSTSSTMWFGEPGPSSAQSSASSLQACAETLHWIRTSQALWPICTYIKSERNQGRDSGYGKLQCLIICGQITDCVCSDYLNKLKVGGGGTVVNEACMIVGGGGSQARGPQQYPNCPVCQYPGIIYTSKGESGNGHEKWQQLPS